MPISNPAVSQTPSFESVLLTALTDPTTSVDERKALSERLLRQVWAQNNFLQLFSNNNAFTGNDSSTSGASAQVNFASTRLIAGTDAGGHAGVSSQNSIAGVLAAVGDNFNIINFSREFWFRFAFCAGANAVGGGNSTSLTTNGFARFTIGKTSGSGALAQKGFGFTLTKNSNTLADVKILSYDSSLHTSASIGTINLAVPDGTDGGVIHAVDFYNAGDGNLHYFLDDDYKGSVATGPTGKSSYQATMVAEINNNGDTTANEIIFVAVRAALKKN